MGAVIAEKPLIAGHGTPELAWQAWNGLADLPVTIATQLVPPNSRAVIVAPHPDDEVLACGGLLQQLHAQGSHIVLLAVTDGEASHPGSRRFSTSDLARLRPRETEAALQALGLSDSTAIRSVRAHLADGRVNASMDQLHNLLLQLLRPGDVVFVTWRQDGHPDHEACGLAAVLAARACGATLVETPVWTWHWAAPGDRRVPWHRAKRLSLTAEQLEGKRRAAACFTTQLHAEPEAGHEAVLPPHVLARLLRPYEVYFT